MDDTCDACGSESETCICFECLQDICDECHPNSDDCVGCADKAGEGDT